MKKIISIFLICLIFLSSKSINQEFLGKENDDNSNKYSSIYSFLEKVDKIISVRKIDKDIVDYIMNLERTKLIQISYAMEIYHRGDQGRILGGLHDYVFRISDDQIRNYIFKELYEHPEICEKSKVVALVIKSGQQIEQATKYDRDFVMGDGVHDYLRTFDRPNLAKLAIALENYHMKQKDEFRFGGLHDYIDHISEEDLRDYITKEINEHLEINNTQALKKLIE